MADEVVSRASAWLISVKNEMPPALCLPATAMATRPPSSRPIGMKLKAFTNIPISKKKNKTKIG